MSNSEKVVPRCRQREVRQEQLLEVAASLFARHGPDGTTTKDIARAAGVSPGLLYHYYPSKEDLLLAVVEHFDPAPHVRALLEGNDERSAVEILPRLLEEFSELLEKRRDMLWLFMRAAGVSPLVDEALRRTGDQSEELLARYLQARVEVGELRPHDSKRVAAGIYQTIAMEHLRSSPARTDVTALADTLLYGLVPRD